MRPFSIAVCFGLWLTPIFFLTQATAQSACHFTMRASVEVAGREFSLADLMDRDACPEILRAAARMPLGRTPLAGSVRVLEGEAVRTLLLKLSADARPVSGESATMRLPERIAVPERITVRQAGARASCADIVRRMPASFTAPGLAAESGRPDPGKAHGREASPADIGGGIPSNIFSDIAGDMNCGAADRIAQQTPLEFSSPVWDPTLRGWEVYAHCSQPRDCVPFLVRLRSRDSGPPPQAAAGANRSTIARLVSAPSNSAVRSSGRALPQVRPGQTVSLLWDQDGIRLVVPAVALDAGALGTRVRARIVRGGALVPAIVVSASMLRAAS